MNYHLMLQERVRKLVEEEHREVIVVGDINICATPADHCDGHLPSNSATFYDHPARAWFHRWLSPNGPMVDIVRQFHPARKGMFTCWNMKIQARESNYGTRVDYILVTKGLLPWISNGDIQPSLKGSDHCPIYIDLRDEITTESGATVSLRDAMGHNAASRAPPRIAAKHWDEFSGKQTVLSSFFGKPPASKQAPPALTPTNATPTPPPEPATLSEPSSASASQSVLASISGAAEEPKRKLKPPPTSATSSSTKRKPVDPPSSTTSKKRKQQLKGQASIASFFSKPSASASSQKPTPQEVIEIDDETQVNSASDADQLDADYRLACALASADEPAPTSSPSSSQSNPQNKAAWSNLFAPIPPPNCTVHNEPTRLYTVNKQGPNKGKTFYLCSRPVGPGYDKGRSERLRDEVDPRYRCNYFKWASEVRREAMREKERGRMRSAGSSVG